VDAFELSELQFVVDPFGFPVRLGLHRVDGHAVAHGQCDHVGQIVLALRVIVAQLVQPGCELGGGHGHHAGVDLIDRALSFVGIFVFNDAGDVMVGIAHDAAVTSRVR